MLARDCGWAGGDCVAIRVGSSDCERNEIKSPRDNLEG